MNTKEAFDVLTSELQTALGGVQEQITQAVRQNRFAEVQTFAQRADKISKQLENLKNLQQNWGALLTGVSSHKPVRQKAKRTLLSRGLKTPEEDYRIPILQALQELGGSSRVKNVLDIVARIMDNQLNEYDLALLADGRTPRWRNAAQWHRQKLVDDGLLKADSPKGTWEITEEGRAYLRENA